MGFQYKDIKINKLSVIGAGQIGPDICLHFAKNFWKNKVELVLIDVSPAALTNAQVKIEKKIDRGLESGAFKAEMAQAMKSSIEYSTDYAKISGSNMVLEAATENGIVKDIIFKQVQDLTDDNCLFMSNSSHMQPEVIFKNIDNKSRCLVTHYFFPAERNPVVEVVPGRETSAENTELLMGFYEAIGKVPIEVKSSYGYAIDPIFEGLCELAILCLEMGYGSVKEIDKIAQSSLGQGVGPFTALNLTGGNPITNHGLEEMRATHIRWFRSPESLKEATKKGIMWATAKRGEEVKVDPEKAKVLKDQFLGGYFALCSYIIDLGISNVNDLNMAIELALVIQPPFSLMNKTGIDLAYDLVKKFCAEHSEFPFPKSLGEAKENGGWKISRVVRKTNEDVAILTIRRPKVLNALNLEVLNELKEEIQTVESDPTINGIVITGFGSKAFVSGADLNMLASVKTKDDGYENSHSFQGFLNYIESCEKPIICALNGFAFGGGNELAMSCKARIARKGLSIVACQPEVNLGFIPGAGGTQRLPRLIGVDLAAEILRTGRPITAKEAVEIGLVDKEVEGDLLEEAVKYTQEILRGEAQTKKLTTEATEKEYFPKEINIGHLSKKIDAILTRAIYDGANMSLSEGLDLESKLYGECVMTEDMKIGMENFKTNGPKAKAEFVHR
jgi:enoyl-CoA hydratase / 3-hydroxyacyl-CoA dehydrogenase